MVFYTSAVSLLLLAAPLVRSQETNDDGVPKCQSDGSSLERGASVEIFPPTANATCDSAWISFSDNHRRRVSIVNGDEPCTEPIQYVSLPSNVSTGLTRIDWNCKGDDIYCRMVHVVDPVSSSMVGATIAISQTCSAQSQPTGGMSPPRSVAVACSPRDR